MRTLDRRAYLAGLMLFFMSCVVSEANAVSASAGGYTTGSDYPSLISPPQVRFTPSADYPGRYEVTVTLEADGPNPLYQIGLWVFSQEDLSVFASLVLHPVGGNTWSATTEPNMPLAAGSYYIDDILIEDGDPSSSQSIRSGSYSINDLFSDSRYVADQRLTDLATGAIPTQHIGVTGIPAAYFTLP